MDTVSNWANGSRKKIDGARQPMVQNPGLIVFPAFLDYARAQNSKTNPGTGPTIRSSCKHLEYFDAQAMAHRGLTTPFEKTPEGEHCG